MNKSLIGTIIGAVALMASTGVALAESGGIPHVGVNSDLKIKTEIHGGPSIMRGGEDADQDGHPESGVGSDENSMRGENTNSGTNPMFEGKDRSMNASTTRTREHAGDDNRDHGTRATSTEKIHKENFARGGVSGFLNWIFGLPASTTIGDLRAQINASTTADTTHPQGIGFWARIFGGFHFGGSRDN